MQYGRSPFARGGLVALAVLLAFGLATAAGARGLLQVPSTVAEEVATEILAARDCEEGPACEEHDEQGKQDGEASVSKDQEVALTPEERQAECEAAAGLAESPLPDEEKLTGLEGALARVLENCTKNPQASGPVNALERLAANRAKQEARQDAKAERAAEREARKEARAESQAAKQEERVGSEAGKGVEKESGGGAEKKGAEKASSGGPDKSPPGPPEGSPKGSAGGSKSKNKDAG